MCTKYPPASLHFSAVLSQSNWSHVTGSMGQDGKWLSCSWLWLFKTLCTVCLSAFLSCRHLGGSTQLQGKRGPCTPLTLVLCSHCYVAPLMWLHESATWWCEFELTLLLLQSPHSATMASCRRVKSDLYFPEERYWFSSLWEIRTFFKQMKNSVLKFAVFWVLLMFSAHLPLTDTTMCCVLKWF